MTDSDPSIHQPVPQPEAGGVQPLIVEGWNFSHQVDNPTAAGNADPLASIDAIRRLRRQYGPDNVMIGPGYGEEGGPDGTRTSIYIKEGAKPRNLAQRIGAAIVDKIARRM